LHLFGLAGDDERRARFIDWIESTSSTMAKFSCAGSGQPALPCCRVQSNPNSLLVPGDVGGVGLPLHVGRARQIHPRERPGNGKRGSSVGVAARR
jgi:hypothetical protein